jgi:lysophospholipase L1-like esterase
LISPELSAQPYIEEIKKFQQQDSISSPPEGETLFVGSSSFRMWNNVDQYFPKHTVINRGFGGATLEDVIRYAERIILPYKPKQIAIYCGENDIANGVAPEVVVERFKKLSTIIRAKLPNAKIIYVSIKPSPSRAKFQGAMIRANEMIRQEISSMANAKFVDVYYLMLTKDGKMRPELFLDDNLHMNENGYMIWKDAITPFLD